jgi:hypothetical protein
MSEKQIFIFFKKAASTNDRDALAEDVKNLKQELASALGKLDQVEASRKHEIYLREQLQKELNLELERNRSLAIQLQEHEDSRKKVFILLVA